MKNPQIEQHALAGHIATENRRYRRPAKYIVAVVIVLMLVSSTVSPHTLLNSLESLLDTNSIPNLRNSPCADEKKLHTYFPWQDQAAFSGDKLLDILLNTPSGEKAREWSSYYTHESHLPGQGHQQAVWTKEKWDEFGLPENNIVAFDVIVPEPRGQRLALLGHDDEVLHEVSMFEDESQIKNQEKDKKPFITAFHGFSAKGNVTAQYVFVNFGTADDFADLAKANLTVEGKIAIMKYGRINRGEQVKNAENMGMTGVILYNDPQQDGGITEANGYKPYPEGPARALTSIERGSVGNMEYDATEKPVRNGPSIPSLPISYNDAIPLLKALNGCGPTADSLAPQWHGGALGYKGVDYNVGPSPPWLTLNLYNDLEHVQRKIYDVIGSVKGTLMDDEVIILGNHRDSWVSGAGDSNSGSSVLMEVARSFGAAYKQGWRPLRSIVFASWEGEEFGQLGSKEWVRENLSWLDPTSVAYINVVMGASGSKFHAKASPLLNKAILKATGETLSPNQTVPGQTILDIWGGDILPGAPSDAMRFLDTACISSVDFGFSPAPGDPVLHYHSRFDTVDWMERFGDPGWEYHTTTARLWLLLASSLIEDPIISFNVTDYAITLDEAVDLVRKDSSQIQTDFDWTQILDQIEQLRQIAMKFDAYAASVSDRIDRSPAQHWTQYQYHSEPSLATIRSINKIYITFERMFKYEPGHGNNLWMKHVVFGPSAWYNRGAVFPGLRQSLQSRDVNATEKWHNITLDHIVAAKNLLLQFNCE